MVAFYLQGVPMEEPMRLSTDRQMSRLPRSFPVGAVYVVEGRGGQYGHLRVSSRYVIMPGGQRVDVPAKLGRTSRPRAVRRWQPTTLPQAGNRAQSRTGTRPKKFVAVGRNDSPGVTLIIQAPGEAPQPLTLNHPASSPGRFSGRGSLFWSTLVHLLVTALDNLRFAREPSCGAAVDAGSVRQVASQV